MQHGERVVTIGLFLTRDNSKWCTFDILVIVPTINVG